MLTSPAAPLRVEKQAYLSKTSEKGVDIFNLRLAPQGRQNADL